MLTMLTIRSASRFLPMPPRAVLPPPTVSRRRLNLDGRRTRLLVELTTYSLYLVLLSATPSRSRIIPSVAELCACRASRPPFARDVRLPACGTLMHNLGTSSETYTLSGREHRMDEGRPPSPAHDVLLPSSRRGLG